MATTHTITFYPVGNGDTCQIALAGGKRVLFDYCHRRVAEDEADPRIDLKKHLQDELKAHPVLDVPHPPWPDKSLK